MNENPDRILESNAVTNSFISDIKRKTNSINWNKFTYTAAIFIYLTVLGILVRYLIAFDFRFNYYVYALEDIWNRTVVFNPIGVNFRGFVDFHYYYVAWVQEWYTNNWYPFTDWHLTETIGDAIYFYSYPPIFLYFLLALWRPEMSYFWLSFPMVLADAACAGIVFLILKKILKNRHSFSIAFISGIVMTLSPINVIYIGIYWLNPGPVTLFTLLSFYFIIDKKWRKAFFWLAIATMTKQNALFFAYPLFMMMLGNKIRDDGLKKGIFESVMIAIYYIVICLFISIPWIFISPVYYGVHMLYPGKMLTLEPIISELEPQNTIPFSNALSNLGLTGPLLDFVAFGVNSMFFMILFASIIAVPILWRSFSNKLTNVGFYELISLYTIFTHLFMPRGVYKFYSAYYMPVILISLITTLSNFSRKTTGEIIGTICAITIFFGFSYWHSIIGKFTVPLILFLLCIFICCIGFIRILLEKQLFDEYRLTVKGTILKIH